MISKEQIKHQEQIYTCILKIKWRLLGLLSFKCFSEHAGSENYIGEYYILLYLSVSTRAVIGQFCRPYFTVPPANFENFFFRAPD